MVFAVNSTVKQIYIKQFNKVRCYFFMMVFTILFLTKKDLSQGMIY